jgi:hypothetical protein
LAANGERKYFNKNLNSKNNILTDDQVIVAGTEGEIQGAAYTLNNIATKYNFMISTDKT